MIDIVSTNEGYNKEFTTGGSTKIDPTAPDINYDKKMIKNKSNEETHPDEKIGGGEGDHEKNVPQAEPYREIGADWNPIGNVTPDGPPQEVPKDKTCRVRTVLNYLNILTIITTIILANVFENVFVYIATGIFVLIYIIENFTSTTFQYLNNFVDLDESERRMDLVKNSCPVLEFSINCYHYETYTTRDSDGRTTTHTRTVYTHSASMYYHFNVWADFTPAPIYEDNAPVTKYRFWKMYSFADQYTETDFYINKENFIRRNDVDLYYDFSIDYEIPNFRERFLVETEPGNTSKYFTVAWFVLSIFTLTSGFYRSWFLSHCGKQRIIVHKSIQKTPPVIFVQPAVIIQQPTTAGVVVVGAQPAIQPQPNAAPILL